MPKKVFKLPSFDKGLVGNASPRDIPEDAMSYGENVDSRVRGRVQGIKGNETANASYDARVMSPLLGDDNILIGQDDGGQFKKYDIDTDSVVNIGSSTGSYANTILANNNEVYASMRSEFRNGNPQTPKWIGKINHHQFYKGTPVAQFDSSIDDTQTTIIVDNTSDFTDGDFAATGDADKEIMKVVSVVSGTELTVERGVSYTSASSHSSGVDLSPVLASETEYLVTDVELESHDGGDVVELDSFSETTSSSSDPAFEPDSNYFYAVSFVYDGYQESPLCKTDSGGSYFVYSPTDDARAINFHINLRFDSLSDFSRRITSINVYRAEGISSVEPDSDWSLAVTLPLTETDDSTWSYASDSYRYSLFRLVDDLGSTGATYQDNTGISDTLETTHLKYKIGAIYGGYLFVGGCQKDGVPNADKYIFRSKPRTHSIIDWSQDFAILPEEPTALIGFNGRLYAFGTATMYRINPLTMDIEDDYSGVGALNENMVVATNYGMFHADDNNIYHNDGTVSQPIGDSILTLQDGSGMGWQELNKTDSSDEHYASMAFDPINKRLLLFAESSGSDTVCWAYDVSRERWDLYTDFEMPSDTAIGPDGILYANIGNTTDGFDLKSLFTSSTRKNWKVRTKDFDLGSDSGDFYGYNLQGFGEGDFTIKYAKDGGSFVSPGTSTVDGLRKATVASADKKMKSIQLQVESNSASDALDNLTIQFRPQVVQE